MFDDTSFLIYYEMESEGLFMEYYQRLRELRLQHGETQQQLASLLETTQQAYLKYEKGINEMPIRRIIKLCRHYNVSADYLLGLTDEIRTLEK